MAPAAQPALRLVAIVTVVGLLVGGCGASSDTEQVGSGPEVGPVEPAGPESPVGPVGEEHGVTGSANITTEARAVDSFDWVVFNSEGDVVLVQSSRPSLSLTGDDNLHQYIEAVVDDSTLTISTSAGTDIAPSRPIVFRVEVAALSTFELRGVGTISAEELDSATLSVIHSGVGDIRIDVLRGDRLVVDHRGVGQITVSGEVDDQQVSVSGTGEYDGAELVSRVAEVQATAMGKATVWVTGELSATVSDLGRVAFYGAPEVDQKVSGSASMIALGAK